MVLGRQLSKSGGLAIGEVETSWHMVKRANWRESTKTCDKLKALRQYARVSWFMPRSLDITKDRKNTHRTCHRLSKWEPCDRNFYSERKSFTITIALLILKKKNQLYKLLNPKQLTTAIPFIIKLFQAYVIKNFPRQKVKTITYFTCHKISKSKTIIFTLLTRGSE